MTTATPTVGAGVQATAKKTTRAGRVRKRLNSRTATLVSIILALLWTVPTFGLFISSFRPENQIKTTGWWTFFTDPQFTFENYQEVLFSSSSSSGQLASYFINSLAITIPSVLFPTAFAALAAYALAWINFKGRDWLYIAIFALQIVPLQMALVPLLKFFSTGVTVAGVQVLPAWDLVDEQKFAQVWFAHTCFALPFAVYLLHNFIAQLPGDLMEAARVDGATHPKIFRTIVLPLITPALAAFGIFQFLWVWNDLLVALIFAGGTSDTAPLTVRLAEMAGTRGNEWQRLTAGAFVSIVVPLIVFLSLQRFFVRGLLAGSVKG
ncbi:MULTISPECIES: carbohydrate ABC transporter permease [Micromonospora]|uniref:Carbohydrate ABC transporter permease n=1 Tax=Micromonospora solifontis TaxID=2487138 RepID=A0ABX9WG49_9ACTN|nr:MULTISPECIES: carbohydrate ABC transporter permease [Micromonospora]NES16781.1 carbohydrate ABC transporter permease [Micromonospora sp. PPF5-17B]NES37799.1 carbohydrate ABC transporter permease [Micromonospora solifontis]NES59158.1 carbohydrate ABC transporter permease [Micromonospora sp. PPF5-6]RNL97899.1 carbohydrate ABC transporter permease [Micromonospora solifontis]